MKALLKQVIIDFHQEILPKPAPRENLFLPLPQQIRKAQVLMGMRRTGKTWLMYQHMQQCLQQGVAREKLLYLNFEDDRFSAFATKNFQDVLLAYFDLYPQHADDPQVIFYLDEIHAVKNWEKFVRRLLDREKMQIFVTGSSAKMLSSEIATSLRGRAQAMEVFPFNFSEYLSFHQVPTHLSTKNQSVMRKHSERYLQWGGFPEILFLQTELYRDLLQDYVNAVVFRDVIERYQVSNSYVVKLFLLHCLQNIASPLSITKIYHALKSQGAIIGKNTLYDYLDYFVEAYLLYPVAIFDLSARKQQVNPKKIYTIDSGIISAYSIKTHFSLWARFENSVYMELRRRKVDIFYYKTTAGQEVDFIVLKPAKAPQLYQACISLAEAATRQREIAALITAAQELAVKELFVITLDEEEIIKQGKQTIYVLPFWKWASRGAEQRR